MTAVLVGPAGVGGGSGGTLYVHDQPVAAMVWTITHGLGSYPSVTIVDTAGSEIEGDVDYVSANQILLTFNSSVAGQAYLN